jgi:hypothetical protein
LPIFRINCTKVGFYKKIQPKVGMADNLGSWRQKRESAGSITALGEVKSPKLALDRPGAFLIIWCGMS